MRTRKAEGTRRGLRSEGGVGHHKVWKRWMTRLSYIHLRKHARGPSPPTRLDRPIRTHLM